MSYCNLVPSFMTQNIMVINKLLQHINSFFFTQNKPRTIPWIHPKKKTGPVDGRNSCVPTAVVPPAFFPPTSGGKLMESEGWSCLNPRWEYHWRIINWIISQWWEIPEELRLLLIIWASWINLSWGWVMRWYRASMVPFQKTTTTSVTRRL